MNADTGARRRVANVESGLLVCSLAWAPDGVRLAYSTVSQIVVVNTQTGATEVVSLDFGIDSPMDWSRDGRELVVSTTISSKLLDTRTGIERDIGGKPTTGDGRWSPDGERMALARFGPLPLSERTRRVIVLAEPDGRNPEQVTRGAFDSGPAWSPDAMRIYFSRIPAASWFDEEASDNQEEIYALDPPDSSAPAADQEQRRRPLARRSARRSRVASRPRACGRRRGGARSRRATCPVRGRAAAIPQARTHTQGRSASVARGRSPCSRP